MSKKTAADYPVGQDDIDYAVKKILTKHKKFAQSEERPFLDYVVGQPASGKSTAIRSVRDLRDISPLVIDSDVIRGYHPAFAKILADDPVRMDVLSNGIVGPVVGSLLDTAKDNQWGVVIENTLTNQQVVKDTVSRFQQAGYQVHCHVVATPARVSRLGIIDRYHSMKQVPHAVPRWTSLGAHDHAFDSIPDNLRHLQGVFDHIRVLNRDGEVFYHGNDCAQAAVVTEQARRRWTHRDQQLYVQGCERVAGISTDTDLMANPDAVDLLRRVVMDARRLGIEPGFADVVRDLRVPKGTDQLFSGRKASSETVVPMENRWEEEEMVWENDQGRNNPRSL
ncbi:AAA family ATPase [Corynebacterium sp. 3HC-13]|uniref:zeta toxin family protein n=1 Tax=Corynebacterium poyangense TaxID=2684405 RepID=UPI001CCAB769|nr:zeta toxin family protein [Corynebacterium poyangense]MBZ8176200.1 AAA family ATPase [Corynebacterium poyangense]